MAYPASFDSLRTDLVGTDYADDVDHAGLHNAVDASVMAVQAELGLNPSGGAATVTARLTDMDATVDALAARMLSGTAAPEGTVSAALGSTYLQTSGAATRTGMMSWRKTGGGTGATGWSPEGALADTGWRDVSASLNGGWTGTLMVARRGSQVSVRFINLAAGSGAAYATPSGFRHAYSSAGTEVAAGAASVYMDGNGIEPLGAAKAYASAYILLTYTTNDAWPASLPGSAV